MIGSAAKTNSLHKVKDYKPTCFFIFIFDPTHPCSCRSRAHIRLLQRHRLAPSCSKFPHKWPSCDPMAISWRIQTRCLICSSQTGRWCSPRERTPSSLQEPAARIQQTRYVIHASSSFPFAFFCRGTFFWVKGCAIL